MKLLIVIFFLISGFVANAQTNLRAVMVNTNGVVQKPTNFITTNSLLTQTNADTRYQIKSINRVKPSNTSISDNSTFAADPHLQISNLPVGRWRVELSMQVYDDNNAGFKWQFAGTASNTVSARGRGLGISSSTLAWQSFTAPLSGENVSPWLNATRVALIWFEINTTTAGSFNIEWAQNTSNAQNTTLNSGSYLQLISLD
jgi:hypothetical protein